MSAPATDRKLPEAFQHLSEHLHWASWEERERMERHASSTVEELAVFYDAMLPETAEIFAYLEKLPADDSMSTEDRTLFSLAVAFAEIAGRRRVLLARVDVGRGNAAVQDQPRHPRLALDAGRAASLAGLAVAT